MEFTELVMVMLSHGGQGSSRNEISNKLCDRTKLDQGFLALFSEILKLISVLCSYSTNLDKFNSFTLFEQDKYR